MLSPDTRDVVRIARTYAYKNGLSMTQFAKLAGVSKAWLSRLHHGKGDISLEYANKMLEAAGYKLIIKHQSTLSASDTQPIDMIDEKNDTLKNDDKRLFKEKPKTEKGDEGEEEEKTSTSRLRKRIYN